MKKTPPFKIWQKTTFLLAHEHNARNIAFALSSSGYLVKVNTSSAGYLVVVYTFNQETL